MNLQGLKVVLATSNVGKLKEFQNLLGPLGLTIISQEELGIASAPEPHATFLENALTKARHACHISGLPSLADDSGICVDALDGAPGIYSARFAGERATDTMNNQKLINLLADHPQRLAKYVCALVFMRHASDPEPLIAMGQWFGEIIDTPKGTHGFGYDPHFYIPSLGKTAAELSAVEKNTLSHRAQAMQSLIIQLGRNA
jgi:XTP/dITP diphosphohydrolase